MLKIKIRERGQSFGEEMCKAYTKALQSPKYFDKTKHSLHTSDLEAENCQDEEPYLGSLGLFNGPKYFIKVKFCASEGKCCDLECMLDSGC